MYVFCFFQAEDGMRDLVRSRGLGEVYKRRTWIGVAAMWLGAQLPLKLQWWLGKRVGDIAYRFAGRRKQITDVNIRLCFPELSETEKQALVKASFRANGMCAMELSLKKI